MMHDLSSKEPIIIEIDPKELKNGIVVPKVKYQVVATVEHQQVFNGMVLPIPRVLIYYLSKVELQVVATIIEQTNEVGECALTVKEIAKKIKGSTPTTSTALYALRRMGILKETPNGQKGAGRIRTLNYDAIQHLNDLVEGEDPGVFARLRKATRKSQIQKLGQYDLDKSYDSTVLPPDHDPEEEEEYD